MHFVYTCSYLLACIPEVGKWLHVAEVRGGSLDVFLMQWTRAFGRFSVRMVTVFDRAEMSSLQIFVLSFITNIVMK
jgi:hypothetical protein